MASFPHPTLFDAPARVEPVGISGENLSHGNYMGYYMVKIA